MGDSIDYWSTVNTIKLQQKLGIKILYVMPDGEVRIPNEKE